MSSLKGGKEKGRRVETRRTCSFIRCFDPVCKFKTRSVGGSKRFPFPGRKKSEEGKDGWISDSSSNSSSSTPFLPPLPPRSLLPLPSFDSQEACMYLPLDCLPLQLWSLLELEGLMFELSCLKGRRIVSDQGVQLSRDSFRFTSRDSSALVVGSRSRSP